MQKNNSENINWQLNLAVLWIAVFLCAASYTSCIPFLPLYIGRELGVAPENVSHWAGICYAATFIGSSLMAPVWGGLADYIGQKKMALRAGIGLALTYFLLGVCQNVYHLLGVRAFCGLVAGFVPANLSMASQTLPKEKLGWGMGLMHTALSSGSIMGPLMGGYMASWFGMRASFFVGSVALMAATCAVTVIVKEKAHARQERQEITIVKDLKESLHNKELLFIMAMFCIVQSCIMTVQPLVTIYVGELMHSSGTDVIKASGVIFSLAGLAGIIAAPYWGKRGQRKGYVKTFALVTFLAGFINLFQIFIQDVYQFGAIQFIYGLALAGAIPNINANLSTVTDAKNRGKGFGLVTSAQQFGGVVGPLFGGFLGSMMHSRYVLVCTGCVLLMTSAYSYLTRVRVVKKDT